MATKSVTAYDRLRAEVVKVMMKSGVVNTSRQEIEAALERPPGSTGADLALPCFFYAKKHKKNPVEMANNIVNKIQKTKLIEKAQAFGPYINFYADWKMMGKIVLDQIFREGPRYGHVPDDKPESIMLEYSSPNTNKPLHLGHLRNDSLGMALFKILESRGHKVRKAVLFNDRGVGISKCMLAYKKWGKGSKPGNKKPDHFVGDFYVMFEKRKTKTMEDELGNMVKMWEEGDREVRALWDKMVSWVLHGFRETYRAFGSKFDTEFRESDYYDKAEDIIKKGLDKRVFTKEHDGAIVADLEKQKLTKKVIKRSDGTSLYVTTDLALGRHKFENYKTDRSIWVVGSEQDLYFQQLFKIFELLGFKWYKNCIHYSHGLVHLPEGKMKSREGLVVDADDIIDEMGKLAKTEIRKREKFISKKELEKRANSVALGALKYFLLKAEAKKNIQFNPKESISFEGDTGPYVQYACARACSILRKSKKRNLDNFDAKLLTHEKEKMLIRKLMEFPETVRNAAAYLKPNFVANYAHELATIFNNFYETVPVLKEDDVNLGHNDVRMARLALVKATITVLENALYLLNINTPDKM